jgi:hypothetical protein
MARRTLARVVALGLALAWPVRADADAAHAHSAPDPLASPVGRADGHAPIGVMGDHTHAAGEWMLSYRYMFMSMRGNRDGTERVSASDVLAEFPVTPTAMDMEMHMFGVMYAPHDRITLMAMLPYLRLDMEHRTRSGASFTTRSDGIGDVKVEAIGSVFRDDHHHVMVNLGVSAPTGTLRAEDNLPFTGGERVKLPYPMQLGSGTPDLRPAVTWTAHRGRWSLGSQVRGTVRIGRNREGYRLGHALHATGWAMVQPFPWLSFSARLAFDKWKDIVGDDGDLNDEMVPTADPSLRAGRRVDVLLGANFLVTRGRLAGHRFAVEVARPVHQSLDGPQLETDWIATAGWQLAF